MSNKNKHLSDLFILASIVDYEDLNQQSREHLTNCPSCHAQRESLLKSLDGLGKAARAFCPSPPAPPRLWESQQAAKWWTVFTLPRPMLALAGTVASVLIALVVLQGPQTPVERPLSSGQVAAMAQHPSFEEDLYEIVENTLPPEFMDLAGETYTEWDQDLYDFLAPEVGSATITLGTHLKGALV